MIVAMWKCAVLLLSISGISCEPEKATVSPMGQLGYITKMDTSRENKDTVWIIWHFQCPPDVPLSNVTFVLDYGFSITDINTEYLTYDHRPLRFRLTSLAPGANYYVKIRATSPGWIDSRTSIIAFDVEAEAPSAPKIIFVSLIDDDLSVEYLVFWSPIRMPQLSHYELEVCSPVCNYTIHHKYTQVARVAIGFGKNFTARVTAYYAMRIGPPFTMSSELYHGKSPPRLPEEFLKVSDGVTKVDDNILLHWKDSYIHETQTIYYDVFVCDPALKAINLDGGPWMAPRASPVISVDRENPIGDWYHKETFIYEKDSCTPSWLDKVSDEYPDTYPGIDEHQLKQYFAVPPHGDRLLVNSRRRIQGSLWYQIFIKGGETPMRGLQEQKTVTIGPALSAIYGFKPYSPIFYEIRACVYLQKKGRHLCGDFWTTKVRSATAAPSVVTNMKYLRTGPHSAVITWGPPETPRGPIEGYKMQIRVKFGGRQRDIERSLGPEDRSYSFTDMEMGKLYRFGVLAYNKHSEQPRKFLGGEYVYVFSDTPLDQLITMNIHFIVPTLIGVCIVLGVIAICARRKCRRRRRDPEPAPEGQELRLRPGPEAFPPAHRAHHN